ncbi:MAG: AtpZ/AtpI family protein [Phycisphaerales bacterium]|nr:AtpZ/AtpI family protein [Phycisphaerales bacterium]
MPLPFGNQDISPADRNRMWRLSAMGFTLATEVAAGTLLGWLIDWYFQYDKTFTIVGAIVGVLVGMSSFIRTALAENRTLKREDR